MQSDDKKTTTAATPVQRPRFRRWFAGGFGLVFAAMLLLVRMTSMHSSGQYATESPLWRFYADGIPRLFSSSTLGPGSGGGSALVETALFHLLFSAVGGCVGVGVAWCVGGARNRGAASTTT